VNFGFRCFAPALPFLSCPCVAGWLVAGWQVSLGFGLGIWFCYLILVLAIAWAVHWQRSGRPAIERDVLIGNVIGMGLFCLITVGSLGKEADLTAWRRARLSNNLELLRRLES